MLFTASPILFVEVRGQIATLSDRLRPSKTSRCQRELPVFRKLAVLNTTPNPPSDEYYFVVVPSDSQKQIYSFFHLSST